MGVLDSVLGGSSRTSGGMSPITMALIGPAGLPHLPGQGPARRHAGTKAGRSGRRKSIRWNTAPARPGSAPAAGPGGGGIGDWLGGLLGGSAVGGILSGGLSDLLKQFQHARPEATRLRSWIDDRAE